MKVNPTVIRIKQVIKERVPYNFAVDVSEKWKSDLEKKGFSVKGCVYHVGSLVATKEVLSII